MVGIRLKKNEPVEESEPILTEGNIEEDEEGETRVDTPTDLILNITKPTVALDYEEYISRDLSVGFIPDPKYITIVEKHISLISDFMFLGIVPMCSVYNASLKTSVNSWRALGGFERIQETTTTNIKKNLEQDAKKKGWFNK